MIKNAIFNIRLKYDIKSPNVCAVSIQNAIVAAIDAADTPCAIIPIFFIASTKSLLFAIPSNEPT